MPGLHTPSQLNVAATPPSERDADLPGNRGSSASSISKCLGLCSLYIVVSASLIEFNKYLMHKDRFPFAMALTTCHMSMTFLLINLLYWIRPSLYPAMSKIDGQRLTLLQWFVPLGCLFALGLTCSNKAYSYCNVAFLQFMKESNVVVVFALSALVGLQQCTRTRSFVLMWILLGASMAVHGEVQFIWLGFSIQALSQVGECGKTVLGEWIMRGSTLKLDPLTYTMFMSPVCLFIVSSLTVLTWDHEIAVKLKEWWPLLLPNACLGFFLNVVVAVLIKECSAVTFTLSGLVKDMVIVLGSVFFFGEVVVFQQLCGFAVCLGGIIFWSHMRMHPKSPLTRGVQHALGELKEAEKSELTQLLARKAQAV